MNASKKFGLKKASQIRDLSEFTKEELADINSVQQDVNILENKESIIEEEKKELVINS